jgi:hypothetical protein
VFLSGGRRLEVGLLETLGLVLLQVIQLSGTILSSPIFWIVVGVIAYQYARMGQVKAYLFGIKDNSVIRVTLVSTLLGIVAGLFGSLLMVLFGITLPEEGLYYILLLAVLLMLIHPRLLCFAYAGGFLSLTSLAIGFPNFNVPHLMALVAVLHMVESILIRLSGHLDALPIYTRNAEGQGIGGFNLQKFWPVPLIVLTIYGGTGGEGTGIAMPDWWPLLKPIGLDPENTIIGLAPAVVGLGYGELALTVTPGQRGRRSAWTLGLYSLILLGLALIASYYSWLSWAAAVFAPLGHELVINRSQREEMEGSPRFIPSRRGLRVLDVVRPSPAYTAGLRSGDIIKEVGGIPVRSMFELTQILSISPNPVPISFWRIDESSDQQPSEKIHWGLLHQVPKTDIGIIPVPGYEVDRYLDFQSSSRLSRWLSHWLQKRVN